MNIYIALFIEKITTLAFKVLVHFFDEKKLEKWKPIHLCWWFNKNNIPIPKYFIGKNYAPTVTTSACTSVSYTSATGNGNITATGGTNSTVRGFCYMVGTTGDPTTSNSTAFDTGSFGTGVYTKSITGLTQGTSYRVRAYAINTDGTGYGTTVQLTTTANVAPTVALNTANAYDFGEDTTPTVNFTGTDTEADAIEYNVQIDIVDTFDTNKVNTWDMSYASYDNKNVSIAGQEGTPTEVSFSADGTKMYIMGVVNKTIYQYTLSIAWDVSTATYASKLYSVNARDTFPMGMFFKPDGTKMYLIGITNDTVFQHTLATPWDISTASYDSKYFSVTSQEGYPYGIFIKSDGAQMWIVG